MHIERKNYKMRFSNDLFRRVCLEGRLSEMFQIRPRSCFVFFQVLDQLPSWLRFNNTKTRVKKSAMCDAGRIRLKNHLKGFNRMTVRSACIYVDSCISQHPCWQVWHPWPMTPFSDAVKLEDVLVKNDDLEVKSIETNDTFPPHQGRPNIRNMSP